jgi:hypothetical protein
LLSELKRLGAPDHSVIISSNVPLRRDGFPYANYRTPDDPGVAVYFRLGGKPHVMASDAWDSLRDNIRARGLTIAAQRAITRYKVGTLDQAFAGYLRLPAPAAEDWRHVLGLGPACTLADAESAYRTRARTNHPDVGGDAEQFMRINRAIEAARKELGWTK